MMWVYVDYGGHGMEFRRACVCLLDRHEMRRYDLIDGCCFCSSVFMISVCDGRAFMYLAVQTSRSSWTMHAFLAFMLCVLLRWDGWY